MVAANHETPATSHSHQPFWWLATWGMNPWWLVSVERWLATSYRSATQPPVASHIATNHYGKNVVLGGGRGGVRKPDNMYTFSFKVICKMLSMVIEN